MAGSNPKHDHRNMLVPPAPLPPSLYGSRIMVKRGTCKGMNAHLLVCHCRTSGALFGTSYPEPLFCDVDFHSPPCATFLSLFRRGALQQPQA